MLMKNQDLTSVEHHRAAVLRYLHAKNLASRLVDFWPHWRWGSEMIWRVEAPDASGKGDLWVFSSRYVGSAHLEARGNYVHPRGAMRGFSEWARLKGTPLIPLANLLEHYASDDNYWRAYGLGFKLPRHQTVAVGNSDQAFDRNGKEIAVGSYVKIAALPEEDFHY